MHISDECLYGDYRGLFPVGQRSLNCSQIGSEARHKCYDDTFAADCCVTCPNITDVPGKRGGSSVVAECRPFQLYESQRNLTRVSSRLCDPDDS